MTPPANAPEEAQQVGVPEHLTTRIAHGLDELEKPDRRICSAEHGSDQQRCRLPLYCSGPHTSQTDNRDTLKFTEMNIVPTASRLFVRASMLTLRPHGSSNCQRFWTPMVYYGALIYYIQEMAMILLKAEIGLRSKTEQDLLHSAHSVPKTRKHTHSKTAPFAYQPL